MKHTTDPRAEAPQQACERAESALTDLTAARLDDGLSLKDLEQLAASAKRLRAKVAAFECALASRITELKGRARAAETLRDHLGMTGHQAKQMTGVAQKLREMPNTRAKLQAGEITLENAASLTSAADECGAEAVDGNSGLLEEASQTNPDHFRKQARRWANAHSPDRGESLLEKQRRLRKAHAFLDKATGMGIVRAELDPIRFGQVRQALDPRVERLRRADSGGEAHPDDIRNNEQRRADALVELLTGRDAETMQPLPDRGGQGKSATQLVVVADLGLFDGTRPDGTCEILGTGPVPPSVLGLLSPDDSVCGIIFGGKGRTLWLGRSKRLGNDAQRLAAAVRDRGCVRCDEPPHLTDLHHLLDWADGGPTDIDNLASLCGPHHRELQDHNLELAETGGLWQTRPRAGPPVPAPPRSTRPPARAGPAP